MVGHLGTEELAALAIAATLLTGAFTLFNFLTYGTTAQVARLSGAGEHAGAGGLAAQALWLATGIGLCLTVALGALAVPLVHLMGGDGHTGELAVLYLRIGSLGLPFALIALAGQGFLRGVSNMRTPLVIVVVANAVNVALNLLFIYGFGWGLAGSAWATVVAQLGMGAAFVAALLRAPAASRRPSLGGDAPAGAHRWRDLRPHGGAVRVVPGRERGARARLRRRARRPPDLLPAVRLPRARARRGGDRGAGDRRPLARRRRRRGGLPRRQADDRAGRLRRRAVRGGAARAHRRAAGGVHLRRRRDRPAPARSGRCSR